MMEELRDIKGLVEVTDYSLYYFIGAVTMTLILLAVLGVILYKYFTRKEPLTQQKVAIALLEKFEFGDAKQSAYDFTHLANYAVNEAQRKELEQILEALEPYKFKKEVPELDAALKSRMQAFIKELSRG
ncbi:hypothetical protein [Sulfurimonas sp. HSL3-7]|uniref:hypothetical protein n=1 Tax=Sulfonitrofixus jiaomeiensis TaxID=3131938 RepID=UPI0031F9D611